MSISLPLLSLSFCENKLMSLSNLGSLKSIKNFFMCLFVVPTSNLSTQEKQEREHKSMASPGYIGRAYLKRARTGDLAQW